MKIVVRYTQESKNVDICPVYTFVKKCRHRSSLHQCKNVYIDPVCIRVKTVDIGPVNTSVKNVLIWFTLELRKINIGPIYRTFKKVDIRMVYTRVKKILIRFTLKLRRHT